MILLIDVGNSNITFGKYKDKNIIGSFRLNTDITKSCDEYAIQLRFFLDSEEVEDAIICSVVPIITSTLKNLFEKYYQFSPKIMSAGLKTNLSIKSDDPKSVGGDLIADCVAATSYYNECLIIDLGTATKFLYLKNNTLEGVVIAPGVAVSTKAMIKSAALLPNIEMVAPKKVLNNSTIPCMQSGIIFGFASLIDGMILRIKQELKKEDLAVLVTGGLAKIMIPNCNQKMYFAPNLILEGIAKIYDKNFQKN